MKTLHIANTKLREYLSAKDLLVKQGRRISVEIEKIDKKIEEAKTRQRKYTDECNPAILIAKGDALRDNINKQIEELEKIGQDIQDIKLASIPKEEVKIYEDLKKQKSEKELERNKVALKVQKIKDRAIPIIQKEAKPHLGEYDDIETAKVKGDTIVVNTFNHLDDWKAKFNKQETTNF